MSPPSLPLPTGAAALREAAEALLQFQVRAQAASAEQALPGAAPAELETLLALFPAWCVQREYGRSWTTAETALWQRVAGALLHSAFAQPQLPLRGRGWLGAAEAEGEAAAPQRLAGPATWELAGLPRDHDTGVDESEELDVAVRWWQGARRAQLPLDADFGETWRALEWAALLRHLVQAGLACRARHEGGPPDATAGLPWLLRQSAKVALRYAPLKPLLRLLPQLPGTQAGTGFTF